ncbi:MAG TPA: hypothetical protein VF765_00500 [Polyangiaceae bacterium]
MSRASRPASNPYRCRWATRRSWACSFREAQARAPLLRALAGFDAPRAGHVRTPQRRRIVLASTRETLSAALSSQPDIVVLDADASTTDRNTWARIASERALGTSFVVGTSSLDLQRTAADVAAVAVDDGVLQSVIACGENQLWGR